MKQNHFETMLYSAVGVAAMFVVMMAFYIVSSAGKVRVDVTVDKVHTLSPGTKKILANLQTPVTVRFYCTQGDNAMPPALRTYAQHVEDLLAEYNQAAQGKLIIKKFDPKPDSDAEESARLNGVEGQAMGQFGSDKIYLGLVVSRLDKKFVLPWLAPEREQLLEYDLSRAIAGIVNNQKPVIGIMTALPVFGRKADPMMMVRGDHGAEPWAFVSELNKDFIIKQVPMTAPRIDDDIKVLLVAHPRDIEDTAQYAIDQFVLRGGKLIAFLDPHAYFDQRRDDSRQKMLIMGDSAGKSSLDKLLTAWGLAMDVNMVVADTSFAGRNTQDGSMIPTLLIVTRAGIDENEAATSQIDNLMLPFAGAFTGKPADGIHESVLIRSSGNSQLVDSLIATSQGDQIMRNFKPSSTPYSMAVHLTGKFKTAFPQGKPPGVGGDQLTAGNGKGEVVLVADSDMLNDNACIRAQNVMGRKVVRPMNGNLNFVQSLVELFSGDDDLISARSRASMNRPFTRLKNMEAQAGRQWEEKITLLESKQRETDRKIGELQTHKETSDEKQILSSEQQAELENFLRARSDVNRELKELRKNLRKDTDALAFWTKVVNIGAMPALVAFSGLILAVGKSKRRAAK